MQEGHFYFLTKDYFRDFPDDLLMGRTDRPCFFAFKDMDTGIFWMVPFSSKVGKYEDIYKHQIKKYGRCETLVFGEVLGRKKAFLIQNMCPVLPKYIQNEYKDQFSMSVAVSGQLEKEIIRKAKKVLLLYRKGIKLIFPNVLDIEEKLLDILRAGEDEGQKEPITV